ncbi:MAG: glycosyltransferase [Candidatus Eisenbacteria bacterium]|uniref:Glycosyltransferase n=1 Tax=Eiseniibacteriota bacterium TaxID=2212470 RepID=A0A849SKR9_UNCEI|nr:glycosyltransferase [Candidatus Eisenbacteria bacterium]
MDLVVLSEVRWGYFRTRKQFLLSRFPERWRVFFAQPPAAGADDPWTPRHEGRVTYFTVPFLKPVTRNRLYNAAAATAPGRALIERTAWSHLSRRLRELGVEPRPVVMASNIYAAQALERLEHRAAFYDFNDHPFQFAGVPDWTHPYWPRAHAAVDWMFVVSEWYRRKLSTEVAAPLVPLGNGVEFDRFAAPSPPPDELAQWPRPWIGYVGLLSHFLDFELLERLRAERRGGTLILIGPGSPATDDAVRALAARGGVAVLGSRPYEQVPGVMQALDVGVIPFRAHDSFVQGINPNKVYQYLAAGCATVTTPLLDLEAAPPHLQFAAEPGHFVSAVHAALDAGRDPDACRALARPHDWGERATRMVTEIERRLSAVRSDSQAREDA